MKRLYAIISVLFLCFLCAGCSEESKYEKAVALYKEGNFAEAEELFYKLGNYEDSEALKKKSDIMGKLQGTYVGTENGKGGFTIDKFEAQYKGDLDPPFPFEVNDEGTIVTFYQETDFNEPYETEWELSFNKDFKPVLERDLLGARISYTLQD